MHDVHDNIGFVVFFSFTAFLATVNVLSLKNKIRGAKGCMEKKKNR